MTAPELLAGHQSFAFFQTLFSERLLATLARPSVLGPQFDGGREAYSLSFGLIRGGFPHRSCGLMARKEIPFSRKERHVQTLSELGVKHVRIRPAGPRRTGRSNGSTGPCSRNGPKCAPAGLNTPAPGHSTVPPHLQSPPTPHITRRPPTHHLRQQRSKALQLVTGRYRARRFVASFR